MVHLFYIYLSTAAEMIVYYVLQNYNRHYSMSFFATAMSWDMNTDHRVGLFLYPRMVEHAVLILRTALERGSGLAPAPPCR